MIEYVGMGTKPDATKFEILHKEHYADVCTILLVKYEGCETFGGNKLMIYAGVYEKTETLDPHFFENHPVVARFVPNNAGWEMARRLALYMLQNSINCKYS